MWRSVSVLKLSSIHAISQVIVSCNKQVITTVSDTITYGFCSIISQKRNQDLSRSVGITVLKHEYYIPQNYIPILEDKVILTALKFVLQDISLKSLFARKIMMTFHNYPMGN